MFLVCPIWLPIFFIFVNEPGLGRLINLAWSSFDHESSSLSTRPDFRLCDLKINHLLSLEVRDLQGSHGEVAEPADGRRVRLPLDQVVLMIQRFLAQVLVVRIC